MVSFCSAFNMAVMKKKIGFNGPGRKWVFAPVRISAGSGTITSATFVADLDVGSWK